jgi:hypothetical protein
MLGVGFEPTTTVFEQQKQDHALHRAASVIGWGQVISCISADNVLLPLTTSNQPLPLLLWKAAGFGEHLLTWIGIRLLIVP